MPRYPSGAGVEMPRNDSGDSTGAFWRRRATPPKCLRG